MTASNRINRIGNKNNADSFIRIGASLDFSRKAIVLYKENLSGLSGFSRLVMYELFEHIDFESGTIAIDSLEILARTDFHVDSLRGRKKEDVTGDTIRNALRSIKRAKPDHFIFSTVNQRIVIEMPFIRELYESFHNENPELAAVLATDFAEAKTLTQSSELPVFEPKLAADDATVLAAASLDDAINAHAIKPNQLKPNNYNPVSDESAGIKTPISDDFYPSQFVIDKALSLGFSRVTDVEELGKFIRFNRASGSLWRNYDYVYLMWIEAAAAREQAQKVKEQQPKTKHTYSRSIANERLNPRQTPTERVIAACSEGSNLEFCQKTRRFNLRGTPAPKPAPIRYLDCHDLGPVN